MSEQKVLCPICGSSLEMVGTGIYRACRTSGCVMFGKDRPYTEFDGIAQAITAAEKRGYEMAKRQAKAVCWALSDTLAGREDMLSEQGMAQWCANSIDAMQPAEQVAK